MPASIRMSNAMITPSVRRAFSAVGSRNAFTPLLTASTPVMAVQPLANALSSSHTLTAATAGGAGGRLTTGVGWPPPPGGHGRRSGWQPHHGSRMAAAPERLEQTNGDRDQQSSDEEVSRN